MIIWTWLYPPLQIHYFSEEAYSSIIYDHYLFDVPKLMDLCVLYGGANQAALRTMLTSIFQRQPKYTQDLADAARGLVQVSNAKLNDIWTEGCVCVCVYVCVCICMCVCMYA